MSKFGSFTIPQLRAECKKRGAKIDGRKQDLVERLEAYDRNANFGKVSEGDLEKDFTMLLPDQSRYRDINLDSPLPPLLPKALDSHVRVHDGTVKQISIDLYEERYIKLCRWASLEGSYFVHAVCEASMKKGICYRIDVELSPDATIKAANCECAAGMGPDATCKHVIALLYGLTVYKRQGGFKTEQTCTQQLQQFHAVKRTHGGSPVKAANMPLPFRDVVFDPRPECKRNAAGYQSHFMNTWKSCPGVNERPVSQLFTPTNIYAVVKDHDYAGNPEDACLRNLGLLGMSREEQVRIEMTTRQQSGSRVWYQERAKRLTASSFGRICKLTSKTDMPAYVQSLLVPQKINTKAIHHGKVNEAVAIKKFQELTKKQVEDSGLHVSLEHPYLAGTPDGIVDENGVKSVLEVKCPFTCKEKLATPSTVPYLVDTDGRLEVKRTHDYFYQLQGQLLCTGLQKAYFVVHTDKSDVIVVVDRDDKFIKIMVEQLQSFFDDYFKPALLELFLYRPFNDVEKIDDEQNSDQDHSEEL